MIFLSEKNAVLRKEKNKFKKSKNTDFSKGVSPWFWSKNWPFIHLLFLTNIGQEKVFYDILERKNAFLRNKKKSSKRRKKEIFPKGLVHGLGPNIGHFSFFLFLSNVGQKMCFMIFLSEKTPNYAIQTTSSKGRKMEILPKGIVHGFSPKLAMFLFFLFLRNIGQKIVFYDILEQKNRLSKQ